MTYLKDAYPEITLEEEKQFLIDNCEKIRSNIRFYLDHLDDGTLWVYKTRVFDYKYRKVYK